MCIRTDQRILAAEGEEPMEVAVHLAIESYSDPRAFSRRRELAEATRGEGTQWLPEAHTVGGRFRTRMIRARERTDEFTGNLELIPDSRASEAELIAVIDESAGHGIPREVRWWNQFGGGREALNGRSS